MGSARPTEPTRGMPFGGLEEYIITSDMSDDLREHLLSELAKHIWGIVTIPTFDEFDVPWSDGCTTCRAQMCAVRRELATKYGVPYWPDSNGYEPRRAARLPKPPRGSR